MNPPVVFDREAATEWLNSLTDNPQALRVPPDFTTAWSPRAVYGVLEGLLYDLQAEGLFRSAADVTDVDVRLLRSGRLLVVVVWDGLPLACATLALDELARGLRGVDAAVAAVAVLADVINVKVERAREAMK